MPPRGSAARAPRDQVAIPPVVTWRDILQQKVLAVLQSENEVLAVLQEGNIRGRADQEADQEIKV